MNALCICADGYRSGGYAHPDVRSAAQRSTSVLRERQALLCGKSGSLTAHFPRSRKDAATRARLSDMPIPTCALPRSRSTSVLRARWAFDAALSSALKDAATRARLSDMPIPTCALPRSRSTSVLRARRAFDAALSSALKDAAITRAFVGYAHPDVRSAAQRSTSVLRERQALLCGKGGSLTAHFPRSRRMRR